MTVPKPPPTHCGPAVVFADVHPGQNIRSSGHVAVEHVPFEDTVGRSDRDTLVEAFYNAPNIPNVIAALRRGEPATIKIDWNQDVVPNCLLVLSAYVQVEDSPWERIHITAVVLHVERIWHGPGAGNQCLVTVRESK